MAAPTLRTQRDELRQEVAYLLGYGRDSSLWSAAHIADIDQAVLEGMRRFYMDYKWTFLRPVVSLTTTANETDYHLPGMFAYIVGPLVVLNQGYPVEVMQVSEAEYGRLVASDSTAGQPKYFVIGSVQATQTTVLPEVIRIWPKPDAAYTLRAVMQYTPNKLTTTITDPPGGANHHQTILAACRAQAKLMRDGEVGAYMQEYQDRLQASIKLDDAKRPEYQGMMRAQQSMRQSLVDLGTRIPNVTLNGVST